VHFIELNGFSPDQGEENERDEKEGRAPRGRKLIFLEVYNVLPPGVSSYARKKEGGVPFHGRKSIIRKALH